MADLRRLAETARRDFADLNRTSFRGDPAGNPRLSVKVVAAEWAVDTAALVIVTPSAIDGPLVPPDGVIPRELTLAEQARPVYAVELPSLGRFGSVHLVANVTTIGSAGRHPDRAANTL
ncbi:MAG TPA: hypothetical protein VF462_01310 [Micromonosporaceae bacterium]